MNALTYTRDIKMGVGELYSKLGVSLMYTFIDIASTSKKRADIDMNFACQTHGNIVIKHTEADNNIKKDLF